VCCDGSIRVATVEVSVGVAVGLLVGVSVRVSVGVAAVSTCAVSGGSCLLISLLFPPLFFPFPARFASFLTYHTTDFKTIALFYQNPRFFTRPM
jgi:hypothetical protein